ncbi:5-oxoprolinase subunit PxpB [Aestuariivivens sp. NBU2969]|uniref:5-oxoprolinase subunit PxpB n=1 Tax=Aestuariivivens sp. NBU2969 TaxID=2873267 RepID=UPI001CBC6D1C|nr:5-oxoprolinase subunit PxpB [Aestuariivivens sp. NBU2969]
MPYPLSYKRFGEQAILIEWPPIINEKILNDLLRFKQKIIEHYVNLSVYINHAYNSLLINYESIDFEFDNELVALKKIYESNLIETDSSSKIWKVPVCYDTPFGIDLEALSSEKKIPVKEIIECHTKAIYTVYFIGFLPGFLYLGGLDERLYVPRRSTPRLCVEKGAVAIGGKQTGVYPSESPGGWHIVGNTPISFFDASKPKPCFVKAGDKVQFVSVSLKEYSDIKILVDEGVYFLESEVLYD